MCTQTSSSPFNEPPTSDSRRFDCQQVISIATSKPSFITRESNGRRHKQPYLRCRLASCEPAALQGPNFPLVADTNHRTRSFGSFCRMWQPTPTIRCSTDAVIREFDLPTQRKYSNQRTCTWQPTIAQCLISDKGTGSIQMGG